MKKSYFILVCLLSLSAAPSRTVLCAQSTPWVTAYYAGWMQGWFNNGTLPAQEIDYTAMTHLIHFALVPNADGTLNSDANSITETNSAVLISHAHAAGIKVLISVGGWWTAPEFRSATSPINLTTFVTNLVTFMTTRGYDGIDIDWEVLEATDALQYTALITALRTALNMITPRPLLTAAVAGQPAIFVPLRNQLDQINLMTYDLSGAWSGWVTWHNSPIYAVGIRFPGTGALVPSADALVNAFVATGVPASKLAIGIDFYGYVWSGGDGTPTGGVTAPAQRWTTAPTVRANVPYSTIMDTYTRPQNDRWDPDAQAAYLSIDNSGSANDKFISYDNVTTCQKKVEYVRMKRLGGVMIWELGGGYRANQPAGQRDLLLQAVKQALGKNSPPSPVPQPPSSIPRRFALSQNYPNPFNSSTIIQYALPQDAQVTLVVYNILGQQVTVLVDKEQRAGFHEVRFQSTTLSSGTYFYRLSARPIGRGPAETFVETKRMLLLK